MEWNLKNILTEFSQKNMGNLLSQGLHGLERESLRVDAKGNLAMTPHPAGLGDKLTNPEITTDFSESQVELITPPLPSIEATHEHLEKLYRFTASKLNNELLWPFSMPSRLPKNEEDIPIARFGDSPQGQKNELYRKGLSLRYGRFMQTISGVHYNRSYSPAFWETMRKMIAPDADAKTFINEGYLHLVRNFIKYRWLLVVLFGASPTKDPSYGCKAMKPHHSKALSLRLSRCGYSNPAKIHVTYNRFQDHLQNLKTAVETVHPPYREIDLAHPGEQVQLNDHLLQIGNEYYFPIRLKPPKPYDDLVEALTEHGVEYIEVRIFDLNPFEPAGVKADSLYFSDLFLMFCLLQESPPIDESDLNTSTENQQRVALEGQDFSLALKRHDGSTVTLEEWSHELLEAMEPLATLMDTGSQQKKYSQALTHAQAAMKDRTLLPAFRSLKEMMDSKQDFIEYGLAKARQHLTSFDQK